MTQLSYSFCMSMLHSLWQAGLLWLLYVIADHIFLKKNSPLEKRNLLFVITTAQLALFVITFFTYFSAPQNTVVPGNIGNWIAGLLPAEKMYLITSWLFSAYCLVIFYKIIKAFYTWYHFKKQYQQGLQKPPIDLKLFTIAKAHHFGIKRKIKLWLSTTINTPVTFGFLKPVILLPVALLNNIDTAQAETLVLHELSHIKTNDYLLNWFLIFANTIFFFNPFVSELCKKIRLEREKYCDINVMAFAYSPALYAETLLKAERIKQLVPAFQLAAVSRKKQLLHRIRFFADTENIKQPKRVNFIAPLLGVLLLFLVFSAALFRTTGNATAQIAAEVPEAVLQKNSIESAGAQFVNNVLPVIDTKALNELEAAVKAQQPKIEQQLKKLQPYIRSVQRNAQKIADEALRNFAMPAGITENDATREIIINEESSGSKSSSVKVYRLSFENGQWILKPEWMVIAKEIRDSLNRFRDSLQLLQQ